MNRLTTGSTLSESYLARKLAMARKQQSYRRNERPDDKEAIQPPGVSAPDQEDGEQEPKISGARLEEMLKLAGGQEITA